MQKVPLDVLKDRIVNTYDVEYVIDVLGLDVEHILDAFEDMLAMKRHLFSELDGEEDDDYDSLV